MTHYTELVAEDMPTVEDHDPGWLTEYLEEYRGLGDRMSEFSESLQETNDRLDELYDRIRVAEAGISHHDFALFNPSGHVMQIEENSSWPSRGAIHRFFKSLALGCAVLVFGCIVAANIAVDPKQRGELSTVVACTSAVAAWAIVMMGMSNPARERYDA